MARTLARPANCPRCGGQLARDNTSGRCTPCQAAERDRLTTPPALPATFWEHEPIRRALAERHLGRIIRAYRCHPYHGRHSLAQETVARWLGITQAQLSRVENGSPIVHLDRLTHWAQLLRIPAALLWFKLPEDRDGKDDGGADVFHRSAVAADEARVVSRLADEGAYVPIPGGRPPAVLVQLELLRQSVTDAISGGGFVSTACLDGWEQVVLHHGEATRYRSAPDQLLELAADFTEIRRLLGCRMASSSLRRLTRVTAQMAGLMFLTLIKMGEPAHARHWIRTARIAADEAGDPATRSWVRGQEAYVHYYRGDFRSAVAVASEAQAIAQHIPCAGVPLAAALQARAEASLGHLREARPALDRAEASLEALNTDETVASAFGYDEAQLRFHEGNTYTHLRYPSAARSAQEKALALYPPSDFLDRALVRLDQAICLALEGDADTAAAEALEILLGLSVTQRSGLISNRAWNVYESLPSAVRRRGPAVDLYEALTLTSSREGA